MTLKKVNPARTTSMSRSATISLPLETERHAVPGPTAGA
jgi:hypothetical protein